MNLDVLTALKRLVDPLARRVSLLVSRGVVQKVDDTLKLQNVQLDGVADELTDQLEHTQPYGFTAVPVAGAEALILSVGGVRAAAVVPVVFDRTTRPTGLNPGDVALYVPAGVRVYLDKNADVVNLGAQAATDLVVLEQKLLAKFNAHTHSGGTIGGSTGVPTVPLVTGDTGATKVKAT